MAEAVQATTLIALSARETAALTALLETQDDLDPALVDLNNTLQTL